MTIFAGHWLARRIEAAESAIARQCSGAEVAVLEAGGGIAVYAGADSPLTQAIGVGMNGAVQESSISTLEEFFTSRGAPVKIELCPLADAGLAAKLAERGYRATEFNNVLVRALEGYARCETARARLVSAAEHELWSLTVGQGFFEQPELSEAEMNIGRAITAMPGAGCYIAEELGVPAAGAAMSIREGMACLFADSTRKPYRARGLHRELIAARLNDALAAGCDAATASTLPGSLSQRNYERLGFQVAYTRITLVKNI